MPPDTDSEIPPMGYVEDQIADRRRQLADLDRRRIVLEAELRAFEDVHRHQLEDAAELDHAGSGGNGVEAPRMPGVAAFSRMTPDWQRVVRTLASRQSFRAIDMQEVAAAVGLTASMIGVRSQLTLLTQRGVLRRVAEGEYAVAEEVAAIG
jgi:hypothetical protein